MMKEIIFTDSAMQDLDFFRKTNQDDKVEKIKQLLKSVQEQGLLQGLGKPEILKHYKPTAYSRRINQEHRLIYRVYEKKIYVLSCKGHYQD